MPTDYVSHTALAEGHTVRVADSVAAGDIVVFQRQPSVLLIRKWQPQIPCTAPRYRAVPADSTGTVRFVLIPDAAPRSADA